MKVTLHVRVEDYEEKEEGDFKSSLVKVVGEVKRGSKILYTESRVTDNTVDSVCNVKEIVVLEIELWAVQNTDFMPEPDCLP